MDITHDPQHQTEADLKSKGLASGSIGLIGGIILAISCVAPAYTLTATIGVLASDTGVNIPLIFIGGFLPMFFAAYAYRELNKVAPDCGTSFTWTTKAFGPIIGWLGGWAAILATVIVLSNLAAVGVQFMYQFIGDIVDSQWVSTLWQNTAVNILTTVAFIAIATWIAYIGVTTTERIQYWLVGFQMVALVVFGVAAIVKSTSSPTGIAFSWSWFSPAGLTLSAFVAGLSGSIFAFWGWDSALTVNEETEGSDKTPGRAALLSVISILLTYLLVSIGLIMYSGVGDTGLGLSNPEISDNVFGAVAPKILGDPWYLFLFAAVVLSSAASLITTFLPTSRTLLAMGAYKAVPPVFAKIHPKYLTPSVATVVAGLGAAVFHTVLTIVSDNALRDTILSIGIMITFYYSLTAFACVWYFRKEWFSNASSFIFKLLLPLLGGLGLFVIFILTLKDSWDPDYGSGAAVAGIGLVFVLGVGLILSGLVLMAIWWARCPDFFKGETLRTDTPALVID